MRRRDVLGLIAVAAPWSGAWAHPMPNSTALVEVRPGSVRLTVSVPMSELIAALGSATTEAELKAQLEGYFLDHATVLGADGHPWPSRWRNLAIPPDRSGDHAAVVVELEFTSPSGASSKPATLRYDAVTHRVASHYVLVYRRDGEVQVPTGRLQAPATELALP